MAEDLTLYVKEGVIVPPQEAPQTPPNQQAQDNPQTIMKTVKVVAGALALKQIATSTISQIGFATGNYELQETIETVTQIGGIGLGLLVPGAAVPIAVGLTVKTGFDVWATGVRQNRAIYQQQQNQILTGKISVNGGRY